MDPISSTALKVLIGGLTAKAVVDRMLQIRQQSQTPQPQKPTL